MVNNKSSIVNSNEPTHFESLYPAQSRTEEIDKLLSFVKTGNSCQVISLPGAGRSNLFGLLSYNRNVRIKHLGENQKWFHFVTVNFFEVRRKPLLDATKLLFLALIDSLRERNLQEEYKRANEIFKESLSANDELVLFGGLKKTIDLLAIEKELTIVFLFDRFEEYIPMLTPEFFANLRVLRDRAKYRFSAVFSLNRPLEDIVEPTLFAGFYEFLADHTIYLSLLDKPSLEFRISYIEKVGEKALTQEQKDKIIIITAGHGKLTRVCIESLLNNETIEQWNNGKLSLFLLNQKTVQKALFEIWNSLTPFEQKLLLAGEKDATYLENVGLIKNNDITIPLFAAFLTQERSVLDKEQGEELTLDDGAREIKKGGTILSDKLTSSEFRLLRYFLQNPNRVIERNEIISSVWQEAKSTAGVTDQALDQLIFRVRRKIEKDPNNPVHLQTVKGRGFRFIP